jgi:hypothetical protein
LDRKKLVTRGVSLAVCATLVIGGLVVSAHADNAISRALHDRKVTVRKLEILHEFRRVGRQNLHHQIRNIQARIHKVRTVGPALASDRQRFNKNAKNLAKLHVTASASEARGQRATALVLRTADGSHGSDLRIFRYCPVRNPSMSRTTSVTRCRIAPACRHTSTRATT